MSASPWLLRSDQNPVWGSWESGQVRDSRHVGSLSRATPEELTELMRLTRDAEIALTEAYRPQGINVGVNLGRPAGAGIVDHLHIHLVPRWTGDTSFISVVGNTRVLPEELPATAARLRPIFERLQRGNLQITP